jgi:hypothetical protein
MKPAQLTISNKPGARRIKPLHGVNGGPLTYNLGTFGSDTSKYFKEAGIPFSRLHDIEYPLGSGEFVDIHCVFPNFDADPTDPASYNFTCTDAYMQAIVDTGCEPFYRLGESIDHGPIKKHVRPPKDNMQWARICEGIIRHYNEGWADGFHHNIRYWEIWNEPENPPMWTGTEKEFFALYTTTANHLKSCFPDLKIGGYGSCGFYATTRECDEFYKGFVTYFDRFLDHIKAPDTKAPLDFFSWHIYNSDPKEIVAHAEYVDSVLKQRGFAATESTLNEWNYGGKNQFEKMRQMEGGCHVAGVLCRLQNAPVDSAMYYDAVPRQRYGGLFQLMTTTPSKAYYPLKAFGEMYRLVHEAAVSCSHDDLHVCAASDGKQIAALVSNPTQEDVALSVRIDDMAPGSKVACYLLDETHDLEQTDEVKAPEFILTLKRQTVVFFRSV